MQREIQLLFLYRYNENVTCGRPPTHRNFTSQKVTGRPQCHLLLHIYFWICSEPLSDQVQREKEEKKKKKTLRLKRKTEKSTEPIIGSIKEKIISSEKL